MEIELPNGTVLDAPDGANASVVAKAYLAKHPIAPAPAAEPIAPAGSPDVPASVRLRDMATRFAKGAESLVTGPLQLGANLGTAVNKYVAAPLLEAYGEPGMADAARRYAGVTADAVNAEMQQREIDTKAAQQAAGNGTTDVAGTVGAIVPALGLGGAKVVARAIRDPLLKMAAKGAGAGAAFSAVAPTGGNSEDYVKDKTGQIVSGTALGAAIPGVGRAAGASVRGVQSLGRAGRDIYDIVSQSPAAIDRLKQAYYKKLIGDKHLASVESSLRSADDIVPGGKATAAEAVSNNTAATPLQAQQKVTLGTAGGPSAEANHRLYMQGVARKSAELERDAVTAPMREAALQGATNVDHAGLNSQISNIMSGPGQAVTTTRNFLTAVQKDITAAKSAPELYAIRKRINDLLSSKLESDQAAVSGSTVELGAMKRAIDDAIDQGGGGKAWKSYLNEYAKRSKAIEASEERAKNMYKPAQKTAVPGSSVVESTSTHLPNLLSRTAMIANALAKTVRRSVEPKLDASMTNDFLNPGDLANVLKRAQGTPSRVTALINKVAGTPPAGGPPTRPNEPIPPRFTAETPPAAGPRAPAPTGPNYADVLSHHLSIGEHQPAGLSLAPERTVFQKKADLSRAVAELKSQGLGLLPGQAGRKAAVSTADLARVMAEGVPEGTVQRTAKPFLPRMKRDQVTLTPSEIRLKQRKR